MGHKYHELRNDGVRRMATNDYVLIDDRYPELVTDFCIDEQLYMAPTTDPSCCACT